MKNWFYSVAGATLVLASTITVLDFATRKKKEKDPNATALAFGLIGLAAGMALASKPAINDSKKLALDEDVINDEDAALVHQNISEVLGTTADRGPKVKKLHEIEVDEETSIEDFIFD